MNIFARFPLKSKFCNLKTKLFCEMFFKNKVVQLKNEIFLRVPLKTKLLGEISFKNKALKIKNSEFLRNFF